MIADRIDVLAVLDRHIEREDSIGGDLYCGNETCSSCGAMAKDFRELREARAAVAELIAAAQALAPALRSVQAVTEMELHQLATGETKPGYSAARRAAEAEVWLLVREHGPTILARVGGAS